MSTSCLPPLKQTVVVHYSNSSTWAQVKAWPRFHSVDVICTVKPVLNAAWHGTPTVPGMDTHAHDMSPHPRGVLHVVVIIYCSINQHSPGIVIYWFNQLFCFTTNRTAFHWLSVALFLCCRCVCVSLRLILCSESDWISSQLLLNMVSIFGSAGCLHSFFLGVLVLLSLIRDAVCSWLLLLNCSV